MNACAGVQTRTDVARMPANAVVLVRQPPRRLLAASSSTQVPSRGWRRLLNHHAAPSRGDGSADAVDLRALRLHDGPDRAGDTLLHAAVDSVFQP